MSIDGVSNTFYPITLSGLTLTDSLNTTYIPYSGATEVINLNSQNLTNVGSIQSNSSVTVGKNYQVIEFLVYIDIPMEATIHLNGDLVPFKVDDIVTLAGSDTPLMNSVAYQVIEVKATTFIVLNINSVLQGDYFPVGAFMYLTGTGLLTTNDLSIVGTMITNNIDAINIIASKVTSPVYTTTTNSDLTILGKNSKNINMSINGTNILQITGTSIIPYQPITGYLTNVLASTTYLSLVQAGLVYAPKASPIFSGLIKFPSASDQLSTAQMSINLGNTVSNNINLLTNKDTFTVVTNAISNVNGLSAFAGIHIQPFNPLGGQQDYYTGISWTSNVNITGNTHAGIYCRGTSYVGTRLHFCTTDNNLVGNKERMVLNQLGYLGLNNMDPQTMLDVYGGCFNVWTGTRFAYGQSPLAGSIILGSTSVSYGGGTTTTNAWQTGMMMETNNNQEISVHHSGDSVRSLLYYEGGNHRIILGRNCGWGTSPVHTHDTLTVGSTLSVVGDIRPLGNTAMYWDTGNGIRGTSTITYGNVTTTGGGSNSWQGYDIGNRYTFMMATSDNNVGGIHSNSPNEGWLVYWQGSGTGKSFNIAKKCSIGTTDAPSYTCHIRGDHCVQGGDNSKTIYGPNSSWGCYLCIGGGTNRCTNSIAQMITTNGNLHIDCSTDSGRSIYLNYYAYNGGIGPANQNTQIWGPVYMNGLVNQNSNYSQIVSGINGAALMYSQFWSTISASQSAWASGWSSANFNKTSSKSTLRFEGYCSYYVSASSMNYINVRIYNSYTNQYSYYNTNLFTNVTYNHAPCPISFCIKDIDAGFCNVYWYMSGSNWVSDSNDYITVTTIIQPD